MPRRRVTMHGGEVFGFWTTISESFSITKRLAVLCRCQCGTVRLLLIRYLLDGESKSCGCGLISPITHGKRSRKVPASLTYSTWLAMKTRCTDVNNPRYHHYGGRGIEICPQWIHSFETFLADMGERPSKEHSIERINNNGNYEPGNCKWATHIEQGYNRRSNRTATVDGETKCVTEWCLITGVNRNTAFKRIKDGMNPADAVTRPPNLKYSRSKVQPK